jgi:hypothetical protein
MQQMQQREQQRPGSTMLPQQRQQFNPYQQQGRGLGDLMSMMGIRRSMPQPRMSMDVPQYQRAMSMDMPQTYGHMEALPQDNALTRGQASEQALRDASAQRFAQMYRMG